MQYGYKSPYKHTITNSNVSFTDCLHKLYISLIYEQLDERLQGCSSALKYLISTESKQTVVQMVKKLLVF